MTAPDRRRGAGRDPDEDPSTSPAGPTGSGRQDATLKKPFAARSRSEAPAERRGLQGPAAEEGKSGIMGRRPPDFRPKAGPTTKAARPAKRSRLGDPKGRCDPIAQASPFDGRDRQANSDFSPPTAPPGTARRLLALAWTYRGGCLAILILSFAEVGLAVAGLKAVGYGIDVLRQTVDPSATVDWPFGWSPPPEWSPRFQVLLLAIAVFGIALLTLLVRYCNATTAAWVMQGRLVVDLRSAVYAQLQRLSFRFFDANETGGIIQRVTSDVQGLREFVEVVLLQSVLVLVSLVVYLVIMLSVHVPLTLACLASTPLAWWAAVRFSRAVRPAYRASRELLDRLVRHLIEDVQGVRVVKGFALEDSRATGFAEANAAVRDQRQRIFGRIVAFTPTVFLIMEFNLVILLGYGGYLVITGSIGLGSGLVVFAGLLQQFAAQVQNIAAIANSAQNSLACATRVFEILDAPVEVADAPHAHPLSRVRGALSFEDVGFSYGDGRPVLRDISFHAEPGQRIAILGLTGAGKSSLLSLIPRFYDPTAGRITLDGFDLRDLRLDQLRRHVGTVFQESFLFSTSVADNIAFGHPGATREQIQQAARIAAADEFIRDLPQGYDTIIGERGADLSGGQKQRLALARALLADPEILLLDDATAAIDPATEGEILAAMESAMRGRTTFIVAHRLSTLERADLVLVLDQGRIVQRGSHAELMARDGHYRTAAVLQQPRPESQRILRRLDGVA